MPKSRQTTKRATPLDPAERDRQILAALDLRSEFAALGIVFAKDFPNAAGWIDCYALGRDDRTPSAGCNIRTGRYHDFGGGENVSFWEFAAAHGNFADWRAAREHYAEKVGIGPAAVAVSKNGVSCSPRAKTPEKPARGYGDQKPTATPTNGQPDRPTRNPLDQLDFLDWTPAYERLAKFWCLKHKRGVTLEAIKAAGGQVARYKKNDKAKTYSVIALPVWDGGDLSRKPVAYVIWNLNGHDFPIRRKDEKTGEWHTEWIKMKTIGPVSGGLIGRHGLERLQNPEGIAAVWKVEGPSDLLTLWAAIPPDQRDAHPIVTNAGGAGEHVQPHVAALFAGLPVNIVHDADQAGEAGALKWLAALSAVGCEARHVRMPYAVEAKHGKDLRDWLRDDNGEGGRTQAKEGAAAC